MGLTCVQTLGDRGGINEVAKTDLTGNVIVESLQLDFALHVGHSNTHRCDTDGGGGWW